MFVFDLLSPYLYSYPCLAYRPGRVLVERKAPERYDISARRHRRPEAQHAAARVDVVHPYPEVPREPCFVLDKGVICSAEEQYIAVLHNVNSFNWLYHLGNVVNACYALRLVRESGVVVE